MRLQRLSFMAASTMLLFAAALPLSGCNSTGTAKRQSASYTGELETIRFAVYGMSCDTCVGKASSKLRELRGVVRAGVDFESKKATVEAKKSAVTLGDIQSALGTLGFEALPLGEQPTLPLSEAEKKTLDIQALRQGERLDLRKHLAQGKITLFDYYADWCGPCHLLTPKLERLVFKYQNVALRKVDIGTWESDAANQASSEFELPGLPFTRVFDIQGKLLGQVHGNQIEQIEAIVAANAKLKERKP